MRHCTGGQGHRYLLVKRAEKGLLAGDPTDFSINDFFTSFNLVQTTLTPTASDTLINRQGGVITKNRM